MYDTPITTNCLRFAKYANQGHKENPRGYMTSNIPDLFYIFTKALERETLEKLDNLATKLGIN